MSDQPRDRANAAAVAVLCLVNPRSDDEAWNVLGELARLAAELRSANEAAAAAGTDTSTGTGTGTGTGDPATWLQPSVELAGRLEPTSARWTSGALFPWTVWDEAAAEAFGRELAELHQLAAVVTSATERCAHTAQLPVQQLAQRPYAADEHKSASRPCREKIAWASALGVATAVVVSVIGVLSETTAHTAASTEPTRNVSIGHSAASAGPARNLSIAHRAATPAPRTDLIPRQRTTASAMADAPRRTELVGQVPAHRPGRAPNRAYTANRPAQSQDILAAALTPPADQLLGSALQEVQQQESLPLEHSTSEPGATPDRVFQHRLDPFADPAVRQGARHRRTR